MKIAIDKNSIDIVKKDGNEYIYVFDDDIDINDLLKTKIHCINKDKIDYVDINLTNYEIECRKKAQKTDNNLLELPPYREFKIGIIVPNFNYEHTIEKCLNSILNQTYKNYEIIFVDDCSTDNSVDIAHRVYQKYLMDTYLMYDDCTLIEKMKVIELKQKRLNGGARNEAYLHLSDDVDYIYYVDSDDWLYNENVLQRINDKLQTTPDVLFVGINYYKNGKEGKSFTPKYRNKYEAIEGWSGSCGKVIKKELATRQDCLYNEGTLKEDKNHHCKICIHMKTFKNLEEPVYVWNQENMKSITTVRDEIVWGTSTIRHYADTLQLYLSEKGSDMYIDKYLKERVMKTKKEVENGGDKQW